MKKSLKTLILLAVVLLLFYLGYGVVSKINNKSNVELALQQIPEFSFNTLQNTMFSKVNLKLKKATIFIYFNSECDYCQHEAQSISASISKFQDVQLLFVSTEAIDTIKNFAKTYNLLHQPNITFLNDTTDTFSSRFDATSIPYVLIYDAQQQLVKKHKGQLKAEAILELLK
jgi:peroxiredoxin